MYLRRCGWSVVIAVVLSLLISSSVVTAATVEELMAQLEHPIWTTRRDAALQLGALSLRGIDAVDALVGRLNDRAAPVRYAAVRALGEIGLWAPQVVPVLADTLFHDDPEMRWQAAVSLGNIGFRAVEAVPALTEALLDDYAEIRNVAAWALAMVGPGAHEAIPALIETMNDSDERVQDMARNAVIEIGGPAALPLLPPSEEEAARIAEVGAIPVVIETSKGSIKVVLRGDLMPLTVANFVKLAERGFYDDGVFHRVEDWVVQGGDPEGTGAGGPGYTIKLETHPSLRNVRGAIAMARSTHPDSAGSQFYILKADAERLDGQYAVFGQVIEGMDVVDRLVVGDEIRLIRVADAH
ncbi:MAG: peptidylprolyl isomerase [Limnochordia bacterium]|jgi:peptidyl-prolyl cis-trans isomerase B (cyclophilin B)